MHDARTFWITVNHQVEYVPPGKIKPIPLTVRSDIPVSIRTAIAMDVPLAVEFEDFDHRRKLLPIRWDGESFWRPLYGDDEQPLSADTFETLATQVRGAHRFDDRRNMLADPTWYDWPFPREIRETPHGQKSRYYEDPFRKPRSDAVVGRQVSDTLDEVTLKARQTAANDLLIINEQMYIKTPEPYWSLAFGYSPCPLVAAPDLDGRPVRQEVYGGPTFAMRLDRAEEARQWMNTLKDERAGTPYDVTKARIHIPEAFHYDEVEHASHYIFDKLIHIVGANLGGLENDRTIQLWSELRAVSKRYATGDRAAFSDGIDIVREMVEAGFERNDLGISPPHIPDLSTISKFLDGAIQPFLNTDMDAIASVRF